MPRPSKNTRQCVKPASAAAHALHSGMMVILLGIGVGSASAESLERSGIDTYTLRADVIYAVELVSMSPLNSDMTEPDEQPVVLGVEPLGTVGNRLSGGAPTRVEVSGMAKLSSSTNMWTVFDVHGHFVLKEGKQYLLFLERKSEARFRVINAYSIDEIGVVCGKDAYIHGVGAYSLICLENRVAGGPPPSMEEVVRLLRAVRARASARFRSWSQELDERARALDETIR